MTGIRAGKYTAKPEEYTYWPFEYCIAKPCPTNENTGPLCENNFFLRHDVLPEIDCCYNTTLFKKVYSSAEEEKTRSSDELRAVRRVSCRFEDFAFFAYRRQGFVNLAHEFIEVRREYGRKHESNILYIFRIKVKSSVEEKT